MIVCKFVEKIRRILLMCVLYDIETQAKNVISRKMVDYFLHPKQVCRGQDVIISYLEE
jgi:hypothetical protein